MYNIEGINLLWSVLKELILLIQKNRVYVRIGGIEYALVGAEPDEYIQKVALYVDKKMNEITKKNSKLSTSMVAVLTSLNIADDFFKALQEQNLKKEELEIVSSEYKVIKEEKENLLQENSILTQRCTQLQLELAKREVELREVRNSLEKYSRSKR